MSRSFPIASLLLAAPAMLSFTSCDTVYSRTYAYQKTSFAVVTKKDGTKVLQKSYAFEPFEQAAMARAEMDKEKREADRLRIAAQSSQKMSADKIGTDSPSLKMDSGLGDASAGGLSSSSSAAIPGLDAPAASASMSGAAASVPGMDSASMSGASMTTPSMATPSMSGASMAPAMDGSSMMTPSSPAPAAATPAKPATTMLPGL
jgi:hypothetical protein